MLSFTGSLKIFIALDPIDMRAGVNTLSALVAERLKETAQSGALFVFTHKRRRLIKVLYWDGTGMWLMMKRLEQGTFCWPRAAQEGQIKLELRPRPLPCSPTASTCMAQNRAAGMSGRVENGMFFVIKRRMLIKTWWGDAFHGASLRPMMPDTPRESLLLQELATLREINQAQIAALTARIEQITRDNVVLRLKVDAMARKLFGRSSEKLDPAHRSRRTLEELVAGLPVTEVLIDPEEVKADPEAWSCIGAEETKLIDYTPGRFLCQRLVRRKYVRKDARHLPPVTAPLHTLQDRCIVTPRLLAHTAASHFELHLPYYRIAQMYARLGMPIERQTLGGWMGMAHDASGLIIEQIKRDVFADDYVQIEETPVKYQDPERRGVCGTGYLWVCHNPVRNVSLFVWRTSRATASMESIVPPDFEGILQCDGYQAYEIFASSPARAGRIELAGCMAHMRRKFFEAQAEGADPQWVLAQVQQLYQIEARLREARAGPEEVLSTRQKHSAPIMERLKVRLEELQRSRKHLPQSLTGKALRYALNQWGKLGVFLGDGRVQIDNNLVENTIRPSAIGKKNWLFMGDSESGHRAATFYTLIANCHRAGLNAEAYLTELFERLPTATTKTVHELTPHAVAAKRRAEAQAAAQLMSESLLVTA